MTDRAAVAIIRIRRSTSGRIAWVALVQRLVTKDEEAFSGWIMMSAGRVALAKRYCRATACAGWLQLREKQPGSLQVRRIKSFREPGVHVLKPTSRVVWSMLCDP